ncbi:MAG: efflux RND transporter periplasmic adaptor subunit [Prolixibacteraceae bacterium]
MNRIVILLFLIALISFSACHSKQEQKSEAGKYPVTNPLVMDTTFTKEYVAEIQSLQNIEIRAKVKGYIESILVDEGQLVKAGQILITIRPKEYEAELLKAKTSVKTAELEVQNVKKLTEKNIVSQTELEVAVAKLEEAKAEEGLAELYVSYTKVKAPFSGTIDRLKFKAGSLIDEGTLLTTLSDNKEMYAYFNLSELEYLDYQSQTKEKGKNGASLILANNQLLPYPGIVEAVAGEFDKNSGSIAFRAKFPNPELLLKHGETGKVQLKIDLKNALIIPQKSTFEVQDRIYVYVVDKNNVVQARYITIKQKIPNLYVIESGLSPSDTFLLEGIQSVKEDEKIQSVFVVAKQALSSAAN